MSFQPHTDSAQFHQVIIRARELVRVSRKLLLGPLPDTFLGRPSAAEQQPALSKETQDAEAVPLPDER